MVFIDEVLARLLGRGGERVDGVVQALHNRLEPVIRL